MLTLLLRAIALPGILSHGPAEGLILGLSSTASGS
jgi:hypothetical protein